MDITHYSFAFFIFILVCAAIWFYSRIVNKKNKETSEYNKEQRIYKLYQNVEDMMTGFEEYVEEVKTELDQKTSEILARLEATEGKKVLEKPVEVVEEIPLPNSETMTENPENEEKPKENIRASVEELLDKGMELDEIAKKLEMSRRELTLMMKFKSNRKKNS